MTNNARIYLSPLHSDLSGRKDAAIAATLFCIVLMASTALAGRFYKYEECKLIPNKYNDGDSFHVKTKSRHYIMRLYFVDAPETDDSISGRVEEQAEYFGTDKESVIQLGKDATDFTRKFLAKGFTAYSRLKDAKGRSSRPRYFAMISVDGKYLSNELVRHGLARIYGAPTELPDKTTSRKQWALLRRLEKKAKCEKLGGWNITPDLNGAKISH